MSVEWQAIEDSSAHSSCRRLDSFGRNDRVVVRLSEGWHYVTSSGFRYFRFLFIYNNFIPSGCKPSQYQAFQFRSELLFYSNDDRRYAMNEETQSGMGSGARRAFGNDIGLIWAKYSYVKKCRRYYTSYSWWVNLPTRHVLVKYFPIRSADIVGSVNSGTF